jgi:hypothetical protein
VSTEVFEQVSGRTMPLSKAVISGFDPQPEPPAHCTAILAFADVRGAVVGRTLAVDLGEGEAATLDLDPSLLLPALPSPRRLVVRPRLLLPASGGDTSGCVAALQLVDTLTGWTTAIVSQ